MKIRKATIQDAKGIGKVHVDSWRTTYKNIVPTDFLNNLSYEQRTHLWENHLLDETIYVLVAENERGEIIGFTSASKRETNPVPNSNYLDTLYLLEEYHGKGVGKQLFKEIFIYFNKRNYEKIFVEVLAENKTRYFYEHFGAQFLKSIEIKIGGKVLEELVYEWTDINEVLNKLK